MSIEAKSLKLKDIISEYDTAWFLGNLTWLMRNIAKGYAKDQLGRLSSPMRQLYFLAGLLVSSDGAKGQKISYKPDEWNLIVDLLVDIENEYRQFFFPNNTEDVNDQWKHVRKVAMPSFLGYFNQGPLNYEEQIINWTKDLFSQMDQAVIQKTGVSTEDFLQFYNNLDRVNQDNFTAHSTKPESLRPNWDKYSKIQIGVADGVPDFIKAFGEKQKHNDLFMIDSGIIDRFYPSEIVSDSLSLEKVERILKFVSTNRVQTDYLYYTATKPGNPLQETPIVDIGDGLFQVFEVKQVIHSIENLLEGICTSEEDLTTSYVSKKGKLLEAKLVGLFKNYFGEECKIHQGYYVDGKEQDILVLWKRYAFIIEAKGYSIREPLRDPDRAFKRIKDDFNECIGYAYTQSRRIEEKFINYETIVVKDKNGNVVDEIDTNNFDQDFSIIVNLKSFGQIQTDLSLLLKLPNEDDVYPLAIKFDDLEVFLLTLTAKDKKPKKFVEYLSMREKLHGKLICSDELEICGAFLKGSLREGRVKYLDQVITRPEFGDIFDQQYNKGMGFINEKYIAEKKSGQWIFY